MYIFALFNSHLVARRVRFSASQAISEMKSSLSVTVSMFDACLVSQNYIKMLKRSTKKISVNWRQKINAFHYRNNNDKIIIIINAVFLQWNLCYGAPLFKAGTPPFQQHKIWSWKNVNIIFVSVTSIKGTVTSLFREKWDNFSGSQNLALTSIWINVLHLWDFNTEFCRDISSSWFFMHCLAT